MQYAFKLKGGSASTSAFRMNIQFFMNSPRERILMEALAEARWRDAGGSVRERS